jgi:hypothetical protein
MLPCPCCGSDVKVTDDYDHRSGWGQTTNGWISCRCGLSMCQPTAWSPYPKIPKSEVVRLWNVRAKI